MELQPGPRPLVCSPLSIRQSSSFPVCSGPSMPEPCLYILAAPASLGGPSSHHRLPTADSAPQGTCSVLWELNTQAIPCWQHLSHLSVI